MIAPRAAVAAGRTRRPAQQASLAQGIAFVARQPIFDRDRRLVGYELLYRANLGAESAAGDQSDSRMTGATLVNGILGIGLDQLTGSKPAWVNFSRDLLLNGDFEVLDPRRCIIELLESVDCDDQSIAACKSLRSKGFTLALDDFASADGYDPLIKLAQVVKLSVLDVDEAHLAPIVKRLAPFGVRLLAEKVETRAVFDSCKQLGFSFFQGYHFSRPEIIQRPALPFGMTRIGTLMNLALDPNISDRDIERELRLDPGLSFKLLRIVNSAATGGRGINSILHAIRMVGRSSLYRWLALLFVSAAPRVSDVDKELILLTLERGRFCELIALEAGNAAGAGALFLAGLLSSFDTVLGVPMADLLDQVCVGDDVAAALMKSEGPFTPWLSLATAYSAADWDRVVELGQQLGVLDALPRLYREAGSWARGMLVRQ